MRQNLGFHQLSQRRRAQRTVKMRMQLHFWEDYQRFCPCHLFFSFRRNRMAIIDQWQTSWSKSRHRHCHISQQTVTNMMNSFLPFLLFAATHAVLQRSDVKVRVEVVALFEGLDAPKLFVDSAPFANVWATITSVTPSQLPTKHYIVEGSSAHVFEFGGVLPGSHTLSIGIVGLRQRIICNFETGGALYNATSNCNDKIFEEVGYNEQMSPTTWAEVFDNYDRYCRSILSSDNDNVPVISLAICWFFLSAGTLSYFFSSTTWHGE